MKNESESYKVIFSPLSMCVWGGIEIQNEFSLLSQKRDINVYYSLLRLINSFFIDKRDRERPAASSTHPHPHPWNSKLVQVT